MNMYWLDKHLAQWRTSISSEHKPQAVIISGHQGMGKRAFLDQVLAELLCQQDELACGSCQNCRLHALGSHPDIKRLVPEKQLIKVSMVREITEFFTSTPHCSAHKVAVIEQAHLMNTAAANALLKILEEPPASGVLFLLTEHKQRLMPTIKSRCVELNVRLSTEEELVLSDWMGRQSEQSNEAIQAALQLTDYQPLTSLELLQEERLSVINQQLDLIHQVLSGQASVSTAAKQLSEVEDQRIWQHLQRHFLQLIKSQLGTKNAEINTNHPLNQFVKKAPKVIHILIELTELIRSVMLNLNTQIKKQLLIESVLIEVKKPFNGGR